MWEAIGVTIAGLVAGAGLMAVVWRAGQFVGELSSAMKDLREEIAEMRKQLASAERIEVRVTALERQIDTVFRNLTELAQ